MPSGKGAEDRASCAARRRRAFLSGLEADLLKCHLTHLLQGDAEDRQKLRKKAEEDARRKAEEERQDMVLEEAEALARMVRLVYCSWQPSAVCRGCKGCRS